MASVMIKKDHPSTGKKDKSGKYEDGERGD